MSESPTPISPQKFLESDTTPRWIKDVVRFLPLKSQFILSGNIRDRFPFPLAGGQLLPQALVQYLADSLSLFGYSAFLAYNTAQGFQIIAPAGQQDAPYRQIFQDQFRMRFDESGRAPASLEQAIELLEQIVVAKTIRLAVVADFASRYVIRADDLEPREHDCFLKALLLSHAAKTHVTQNDAVALFNPIFWLCDNENDLPDWLAVGNPRIRSIVIPRPDHIVRRSLIATLALLLPGSDESDPERLSAHVEAFVDHTEGLVLTDVLAIADLCRREQLGLSEIDEAIRRYKLGVTEDPWKRIGREKIAAGEQTITTRVIGQPLAVTKALDIIKRAATGIAGAQGARGGGRPRGVMFLAGPTGTGKTELAKTLTEMLFGDETAYIRFDMSEFSAEHADQRLLGAPPGYIGHDSGGELTNAIKEKPFSVVLFDEIEKAHPRILDKFLQLLDDGVLTSGRGERVYFSEAVIIFTSNLGIFKDGSDGQRIPNVQYGEGYAALESKVRAEIDRYFKVHINRPELLNRIGENIVVFDFIRPETASQIFGKMVQNVLNRLENRRRIKIQMAPQVYESLCARCTANLENGGRGIGNQLEAWFINPLARALFDYDVQDGSSLIATDAREEAGIPVIGLAMDSASSA